MSYIVIKRVRLWSRQIAYVNQVDVPRLPKCQIKLILPLITLRIKDLMFVTREIYKPKSTGLSINTYFLKVKIRKYETSQKLEWTDYKKQLYDILLAKTSDLKQKSIVNWAVEGDENSEFFHGLINKNNIDKRLNGVNLNGNG